MNKIIIDSMQNVQLNDFQIQMMLHVIEGNYDAVSWDLVKVDKDKISSEELKKFLNIKDDSEILGKIQDLFEGWDGWFCCVEDCGHTCGCDTSSMFEHLKTHTIKELQEALK